jgi:hypothetical protein
MKKELKLDFNNPNEIPLILESYEDIFSDFDPRDYEKKALSEDFLNECKKASFDKENKIILKLFTPRNKRDSHIENDIKKRLKEHFNKHFIEKKEELKKLKKEGIFWFILGCLLIIITSFPIQENISFLIRVLLNIAHPAGWFFLWEGLGKILLTSKEKKPTFNFYKKMSKCSVEFSYY